MFTEDDEEKDKAVPSDTADRTSTLTSQASPETRDLPTEQPMARRPYADSDDSNAATPRGAATQQDRFMDKLQGYDYNPDADVASTGYDEYDSTQLDVEYPEEPDHGEYGGGGSDDDSDVVLQHGVVLYDFNAEEDDEVSVRKAERVDIDYEVAGWLQVRGYTGFECCCPSQGLSAVVPVLV